MRPLIVCKRESAKNWTQELASSGILLKTTAQPVILIGGLQIVDITHMEN